MKVKTLNKSKSNNSDVTIKDEIFGIDPKEDVILRVLNWQLANKQKGNHKVKSRRLSLQQQKCIDKKEEVEHVMVLRQLSSFVVGE